MPGLLATKLGMTQIFTKEGLQIPVTVLKVKKCVVMETRTDDKNGYRAVQIGYDEIKEHRKNKPHLGYFKKKKQTACRLLHELKTLSPESYELGDELTVDGFAAGDMVDVIGTTKGKGFQGVIKRHNFAGGNKTHGNSLSHRVPGSIGQCTFPGKVFKNKKLPGQMGNKRQTVKNIQVVDIESEQGIILLRGAVPGSRNSVVEIRSVTGDFEKRFVEKKQQKDQPKEAAVEKESVQENQEG